MISVSEILHGIHRAKNEEIRQRRTDFVEELLRSFTLLPFDLSIARKHAELSAALSAAGRPVGAHDLLIAATAIVGGDRVISRDARSFPNIPTLSFEII
jgi:predicted nucleic acid-binding protein